jgi:DNA-binding NtrC family response regulator
MPSADPQAPDYTQVCLVEDDPIMGESIVSRFELEGLSVHWCHDAESARTALLNHDYGLVISDIRLPDRNGDRLFEELLEQSCLLPPFIFVTGFGDLGRAVSLLKLGAADYLTKPFDMERLLQRVAELLALRPVPDAEDEAPLGISAAMRGIEATLRRVAPLDVTVLITGETGVGKEVVARRLHELGRGGPFFAVNCAAIAEGLVESELFGHEKGAFTGAGRSHRGVFERARGGTLFLDEIGDMPLPMQARLLRVLQERKLTRVGGEDSVSVDVRLVCATHQDLRQMAAEGRFRSDLLYRINLIHLEIPPLRERAEDILLLANRFLAHWAANQGQPRKHLHPDAEQALLEHDWPGNVRDLRHALERACIFSDGPVVRAESLFTGGPGAAPGEAPSCEQPLNAYLRSCEKRYIEHCLATHGGRISETAQALGISRKALWEKMKRLDVRQD